MHDNLLMGMGRHMVPIPRAVWQGQVHKDAHTTDLEFMSPDHHRVRDLAVLAIPRVGEPLSPGFFARELDLPEDRVVALLDDLEKHLKFVFRGDGRAVTWAYPVTVDQTPHRVTLSTGERVYAA